MTTQSEHIFSGFLRQPLVTIRLMVLLSLVNGALAADHYLTNMTYTSLTNLIASTSLGDTIFLAPGTLTIPTKATLNSRSFVGAGSNNTTIVSATTGSAALSLTSASGQQLTEVAGIRFVDRSDGSASEGIILARGYSAGFYIHDNFISLAENKSTRGIFVINQTDTVTNCAGLIRSNIFHCLDESAQQGVTVFGQTPSFGPALNAWQYNAENLWGSSNKVWVEGCGFNFGGDGDGAVDLYNGARLGWRFNTGTNVNMYSGHGFDSASGGNGNTVPDGTVPTSGYLAPLSGEFYGNKAYAGYQNSFGVIPTVSRFGQWRGGNFLVYSNDTFNGDAVSRALMNIQLYRVGQTEEEVAICGGEATTAGLGWGTITGTNNWDGNLDAYGWPACGQPGVTGPLVFNSTNTTQTTSMCYAWANTRDGASVSVTLSTAHDNCMGRPVSTNLVKAGRDFTNGVEYVYTRLPYPHPMVYGSYFHHPTNIVIQTSGATPTITTTVDHNGATSITGGAGTNIYFRNYPITLTAPQSVGDVAFEKWTRDGVDFSTNAVIATTADQGRTFVAVYSGEVTSFQGTYRVRSRRR